MQNCVWERESSIKEICAWICLLSPYSPSPVHWYCSQSNSIFLSSKAVINCIQLLNIPGKICLSSATLQVCVLVWFGAVFVPFLPAWTLHFWRYPHLSILICFFWVIIFCFSLRIQQNHKTLYFLNPLKRQNSKDINLVK